MDLKKREYLARLSHDISVNIVFIRTAYLKTEPGLFLISMWNWEHLKLNLPGIMCLKCFSRDTESFPAEYKAWTPIM